jgi:hypothetical protein
MTRDDIIRMAREAGLWPSVTDTFPEEVQRFAKLVATAERSAIIENFEKWDRADKPRHNYWQFAINYIAGRQQ